MNMYKNKKTPRNIFIVSFFTAMSRLLGLVRDMLFSRVIGISYVADAFFLALRIPNIFRRITSEGAFAASFIPIFSRDFLKNRNKSINFAESILFYMIVTITVSVLLAQILMPLLIYLLAGGFSENQTKLDIAVSYSRLTLPYIIFISLSSLGSAIINNQGKFFVTSLAPIFLNIFLITALLFPDLSIIDRGFLLSFAVSISGLVHFLLIFYILKKQNFSLRFIRKKRDKSLRDFSNLAWPQTISGFAVQFNILISGFISSFKEGGISVLYYAERLYQLPLALIGISIGTVILPHLASLNINKQKEEIKNLINSTLKFTLVLIIPATFGLIVLSEIVVSVIYEYGVFGKNEVSIVSNVLIGFSIGLPAFVLIRIFSSVFYSMSDTRRPLRYSLFAISVNIVLSIFLFINYGVVGIAYATSFSAWIHALIFYIKLRELSLVFFTKDTLFDFIKIIFCSTLMSLLINFLITNINLSYPVITLVILVLIGIVTYLLFLFLVGLYRKDDIKTFIKDF